MFMSRETTKMESITITACIKHCFQNKTRMNYSHFLVLEVWAYQVRIKFDFSSVNVILQYLYLDLNIFSSSLLLIINAILLIIISSHFRLQSRRFNLFGLFQILNIEAYHSHTEIANIFE